MRRIEFKKEDGAGCTMVLGGFDGVHIGHQRLVSRAQKEGKPVGITTIVGGKGDCLFTQDERLILFERMGISFVAAMRFEDIKDYPPEAFLQKLQAEFSPALFVCGDDFRFGKGASGNAKNIGEMTTLPVAVESLVQVDGQKVSTSTLKSLLAEGKVEKVARLLGYPYFAVGKVEEGRKVGRTLGFPTANLTYPAGKTPLKKGVYAVVARVDGKEYKGIANFGARPTFEEQEVKLEAYLDGFEGDLYGKKLQISFTRYLRPVTKFECAEDLKKQLQEDVRKVREDD